VTFTLIHAVWNSFKNFVVPSIAVSNTSLTMAVTKLGEMERLYHGAFFMRLEA